jgi:DNA-binding response OmpR family regulator
MSKPFILVVEDEPLNREVLIDTLQDNGYETCVAATGTDAWLQIVEHHDHLDAILLDRLLPDMDTLSLLIKLKADVNMTHVPVIMQTSLSSEDEVAAGLRAGAYYYLTKPFPPTTLLSIVRSAVKDRRDYLDLQQSLKQARSILKHLNQAEFWFRTQSEARDLATLVAHAAPEPERVVLGLTELMLNAVEHGNLGITYAEKSELIAANRLEAEIEARLRLPEYASRLAHLKIDRSPRGVQFLIHDEGRGFDWRPYIEMSPARAFDTHGRGIAMSRLLSFDRIEFRGCGNEVVCSIDSA